MEIKYEVLNIRHVDISNIDMMTLRYDFLLGNVYICEDDVCIEMDWEWIPLFDFSESLKFILRELNNKNKPYIFEFTECGDILKYERLDNSIKITSSFSSNFIQTDWNEFNSKANKFIAEIENYIQNNCTFNTNSEIYKCLIKK